MNKPRIIVFSENDDDNFDWMSDGWNTINNSHTKKAQELMIKARKAIKKGNDVLNVIGRLRKAGFEVVRSN